MVPDDTHGFAAVACFENHRLAIQLLERAAHRLTDQGVIVDHQNLHDGAVSFANSAAISTLVSGLKYRIVIRGASGATQTDGSHLFG